MKKILVTGVRAPAALDVMRGLSKEGFEVYAADSLKFALGRFSSVVKAYVYLPAPRYAFDAFRRELVAFVQKHHIDVIFPTCEEVFYLSACKEELEEHCDVFCEGLDVLSQLHNKFVFQKLAKENGLGAINTFLVENEQMPLPALDHEKTYVVKPVFSRFGDNAILNLKPEHIKQHLSTRLFPWAIQEHIQGTEYCSYALCRNGEVLAESCYEPYFRAKQGASVYFKVVSKPEIFAQVRTFARQLNYTGQLGFDFIERADGKVFVLECNPRCTSGVHLISDIEWPAAFSDSSHREAPVPSMRSGMLSLGMLMFGLSPPNTHGIKEFLASYRDANDVIYSKQDRKPSILQFVSVLEVFWRSLKKRQSLKEASTVDIEWDGQHIG